MFDDKAADLLQTGHPGNVTFTAGNDITSTADAQAAEYGPTWQASHVVSCIVIARAPPLCKTLPA